ncbi:TonB-dependent receptor [Bacteroides faecis]|uniref:TonB-dependent receptor n=1 Tax=Bacteroides faecis TaxID=674529 RepID=UPI0010223218|nr:carboxypeptidase-like regulatory domain-containing protein [Bacteroides faecis]KAA5266575.1 outer membrane beta-barrel protein [Bacteroides faecis]RYT84554.1 TonB-dependent receptor [Bacteroides faecis]
MRRLSAIFLMLCCALCSPAWSQHTVKGVVKDKDIQPIVGASVIILSLQDTLNHKGCITDENGQFTIEKIKSGKYRIEISFIGYTDYRQEFELDQFFDFGEIILVENTMLLDEVVVTASMVKRFADKKEYKLTNIEKEQYSSALSALEHLPKIQVIDQTVNSVDGKAVKILINGIPSTPTDLSVISPENIFKIDYYTKPPIQYSNMGLGAVINVVTKEKQNGGSVGLNTQNAVTTGFGNNVVNFKYNWGHSQLGVTYNINYRNYNKRILDENMTYAVGGKTYQKQKTGKNSPYAYEQQLAEISFNNSKPDNYIFSTKLSFNSLNRRRSSKQDIFSTIDDVVFEKFGESSDKDKYISPVMDMYFSKIFNAKHELTMNLVGTYYKSDYDYQYSELSDGVTDFETATNINLDKYSLIGEAIYNYNMKTAQLYVGSRYMHNNSTQKNLSSNNQTQTNEIYSYLGITGMLGKKFNYSVSAGVNGNIFTTIENKKYKFVYFRPQVKLGYFIDESSDLTFNYEVNTENPAVSSLTYNPYYKDANYLYAGNPNLKPSNNHDLSLSYFKGFKKFVINAEIGYKYTKDAIAPIFQSDNTNIIETFGNLDNAQNIKASLFLQWYPFSNNILRLRLYSEVFQQINVLGSEKWNHTGYSFIPSINFAYKKWGVSVFYQTERESLVGQTMKTIPSMASVELSYSPIKNFTLTGGIRYPFYDSWKQTTSVSGTSLLQRTETERIINNANMVYINIVYNFTFGKNKPNLKLKMQNKDKDSGILNRY